MACGVAMIRVFNDNGDRTDRKKARLKYLVDRWGMEQVSRRDGEAAGVSRCCGFPHQNASHAGRSTGMDIWEFIRSEQPGSATSASRPGGQAERGADAGDSRYCRTVRQRRTCGLTVWQNLFFRISLPKSRSRDCGACRDWPVYFLPAT